MLILFQILIMRHLLNQGLAIIIHFIRFIMRQMKTALTLTIFPLSLFGIQLYKKKLIDNSNLLKRLQQQSKEKSRQPSLSLHDKQILKHVPLALRERIKVLQHFYNANYFLDHSLATAFGVLGYLVGSAATMRMYLLYVLIHNTNTILQLWAIRGGGIPYDYNKFEYFNRLMVYGLMGVFGVSVVRTLVNSFKGKAIVAV